MYNLTEIKINKLITMIYSSIHSDELKQRSLSELSKLISANSIIFRVFDRKNPKLAFHYSTGLESRWIAKYYNYYSHLDPFHSLLHRATANSAYLSHEYISDHELHNSEYYTDFLRPNNIAYMAFGYTATFGSKTYIIEAHRSIYDGPFEIEAIEILNRILPHISQSIEIINKMDGLKHTLYLANSFLDCIPTGVIILNKELEAILINKPANKFLMKQKEFKVAGNKIRLEDEIDNKTLTEHLKEAAQQTLEPPIKTLSISIKNDETLRLLVMSAKDLNKNIELDKAEAAAVVFIDLQSQNKPLSSKILSLLYGLTPQEARLTISLAQGNSLEDYSKTRGIAKSTARSHLKSIFNKTGTRRQGELIKMVLTSPVSFSTPHCSEIIEN